MPAPRKPWVSKIHPRCAAVVLNRSSLRYLIERPHSAVSQNTKPTKHRTVFLCTDPPPPHTHATATSSGGSTGVISVSNVFRVYLFGHRAIMESVEGGVEKVQMLESIDTRLMYSRLRT